MLVFLAVNNCKFIVDVGLNLPALSAYWVTPELEVEVEWPANEKMKIK